MADFDLLPASEREVKNEHYRNSLVEYLQEQNWDFFYTITFRHAHYSTYSAIRHTKEALSKDFISRAFIASEPHPDNPKIFHTHGLAKLYRVASYRLPQEVWSTLFDSCGRSTVECIRDVASVTNYCSKYVTKSMADYDFYGKWG